MKLITLILGLALGFGGGIWYGVQHPEWAKDFAAKQEGWVRQGKVEVLKVIEEKLRSPSTQPATPSSVAGRSFAGSNLTDTGMNDSAKVSTLKSEVDSQLKQLGAK
jgi:hypothetical protein